MLAVRQLGRGRPAVSATTPATEDQAGTAPATGGGSGWRAGRVSRWARRNWIDIAWTAFIALNLLAMQLVPQWQTVPFLIIWVSLALAYGFRLWRLGSTLITALTLTLATGGLIGWQVLRGKQDVDYLAEVPLIAMMFVVMVWHSRRRLNAMADMRRVSERNIALLAQQRQFLQDVSHELGTPIAIALGHVELIEQAASDQAIANDARVAADELMRIRRLTSRLLLLASTDSPSFLCPSLVDVEELLVETLRRWSHLPRRWSLGTLEPATARADGERLTLALDALIENAVAHTSPGDRIELSARRDDASAVFSVADSGAGIPAADVARIFGRFARVDPARSRATGGFGLGLAIVKAITEAHGGSVRVRSTEGEGSVFELVLPAEAATVATAADQGMRAAPR